MECFLASSVSSYHRKCLESFGKGFHKKKRKSEWEEEIKNTNWGGSREMGSHGFSKGKK